MNKFYAAVLCSTLAASGYANASDLVTESRAVDARVVKINLGGTIDLHVKQGATAALTLFGEKSAIDKVTVVQDGDTLTFDAPSHHIHFGKSHQVRAELTVPNLREFVSHGVGASDISGFEGNDIKLNLDGAGSFTYSGHYKTINASLSGVGSLTLNAGDTEQIDLNMRGAGSTTITGQAKLLHASLGGVGSLEAKKMQADAIELKMSGLGSATVYAKTSASVNLSGLGSATIYGHPAKRESSARGLGSVSWE